MRCATSSISCSKRKRKRQKTNKNHPQRPTRMYVSFVADVCIGRRRCTYRPERIVSIRFISLIYSKFVAHLNLIIGTEVVFLVKA